MAICRMYSIVLILHLIISVWLPSSVTQAAEFSVFGGLNRASTTATTDKQNSYFFGFSSNIYQTPDFAIEFGAIYLPRQFEFSNASQSFTFVEVPILFRYYLGPVISIAIGPSVARALSKEGILNRDYDLGLTAASGMALPISDSGASILIELRYRYGLSNLGVGSFRDTQALIGLKFNSHRGMY